jgi:Ion transport protein
VCLDQTIGCGDSFFATVYFYSYIIIIGMVFMRLFIAIILQAFQEVAEKDNKFMSSSVTDRFREVWSEFDPDVSQLTLLIYRRRATSRWRRTLASWWRWGTPSVGT